MRWLYKTCRTAIISRYKYRYAFSSYRWRWQTNATRCPTPTVLYTDKDGQCDKLVTDHRHQFITLTVHLKPGPHQQQCRSNIVECCNVECCFHIVAVFGNNVEATFDFVANNGNNVERVLRWNFVLSTKSNVASTLLLVWTGLKLIAPEMIDVTTLPAAGPQIWLVSTKI